MHVRSVTMTAMQVHYQGASIVCLGWLVSLLAAVIVPNAETVSASLLPVDSSVPDNQNKALLETMEYLVKYGYLSVDRGKTPSFADITTAMREFQSFMDITPTYTLNTKTLEAIRTPRCGLKDPVNEMTNEVGGAEHTRYGSKWNKTALTYKIFRFPRDVRKSKFRNAIARACQLWSDVTPLTFEEVNRKRPADIDIRFYSGFHNDEFPFDNARGVVAHPVQAEDELAGTHIVRIDVDAEEDFTFESAEGINLFQVMVHQIGHALGLGHASTHDSVMSPCTKPYAADFRLSQADVTSIQAIYGSLNTPAATISPGRRILPSPIIQHSEPRYLCAERPLDAVAILAGEIYVFKGNRYWQFSSPNHLVSPNAGSLMTDRWPGIPSGVHAVYQRHTDNKAVFIKGGHMWLYDVHPKTSSASYTRIQLRDMQLPRGLEAALPCEDWPLSTYLIKRGKVWHFSDQTETVMAGPLQAQDLWEGLPQKLDAAFSYKGNSYFVQGGSYWKVDYSSSRVATRNPRSFQADFLGC